MKIEICEQMVQSWLQHCKQCEIVQTNWSISPLRNIAQSEIDAADDFVNQVENALNESLDDETKMAMQESLDGELTLKTSYDEAEPGESPNTKSRKKIKKLNIIKKSTAQQFIRQCEIDVAGIRLNEGEIDRIYLIDTAFHKNGLGYHDVVATVLKKIIRALLVAVIIFGDNVDVTIAFAAPKCRLVLQNEIEKIVAMLRKILGSKYSKITIELYFNEDFSKKIYEPLIKEIDQLNNDNDLFMRAMNLAKAAEEQSKTARKTFVPAASKSHHTTSLSGAKSKNPIITFYPSDINIFKNELLRTKRAEITWIYNDGTKKINLWDANRFDITSDIKRNLQSRTQWRTKDKDGLVEVLVKII